MAMIGLAGEEDIKKMLDVVIRMLDIKADTVLTLKFYSNFLH